MINVEAIAATTLETGDRAFSAEDLEKLRDSSVGVPVCLNFNQDDPIGTVIGSRIDDKGRLVVTARISNNVPAYLVPGYIHPEMKMVSIGYTLEPADENVTNFFEIEDKQP